MCLNIVKEINEYVHVSTNVAISIYLYSIIQSRLLIKVIILLKLPIETFVSLSILILKIALKI